MDKIKIFKKIDKYLVGALIRLMPSSKPADLREPKNILLIKTVAIGDLVVLLPTIKALKERFKDAKLTLLTTPRVKEVVEGFPFLDDIIYYDILGEDKGIRGFSRMVKKLKAKHFDLSIDFEHYYNFTSVLTKFAGIKQMAGFEIEKQPRRKLFHLSIPYKFDKHEVEAFFEAARFFESSEENPELQALATTEKDREVVEKYLKENGLTNGDVIIGVHPGTSDSAKARRWLPERHAKIIDLLQKRYGAKVIITGTSQDETMIKAIESKIKTKAYRWKTDSSLKEFAQLCKKLDLFISVDTGPMHIAAAMGAKTVGLFGPNTPHKWSAYGYDELAIYKELDCSPCTKQYLGQISKCRTGECMKAIMVEDVLSVIERVFDKSNKESKELV